MIEYVEAYMGKAKKIYYFHLIKMGDFDRVNSFAAFFFWGCHLKAHQKMLVIYHPFQQKGVQADSSCQAPEQSSAMTPRKFVFFAKTSSMCRNSPLIFQIKFAGLS